ncbi:MAG: nitroreductase family deazaflavin-dependent oxidoreductase, partial [Dehalococcoidia bacterium]|nr:nitroreductase family deazaflavin-dependent oxidoreductase [Dehalococcoidia bacterium]
MRSLADPLVARFLRRSLIVRIATLSPAGNAGLIPLYFVHFRGRIWMTTRSENPVVRDLLRNPAVVLLFHGEKLSDQRAVVRIRGQATFHTTRRETLPVYALAALRYYLSPGGIANTVRHWRQFRLSLRYKGERAGGGVIEVVPESAEFLPNPLAAHRDPAERGFLRYFYRGWRPTRLGKFVNRTQVWWSGAGLPPHFQVVLEVRGRKSGQVRSMPVAIATVDGERYLVSMLGNNADWVRNVQAANGEAVIRHGRRRNVLLVPVPAEQRGPVIREYIRIAQSGRKHFPVAVGAPLAD